MFKKFILLTSFILVLGLIGSGAAFGEVIEIRVADGGDDAEQHLDDGDMDVGSSDLELANEDGGDPATDEQVIGLRFVGIPLDKGALITGAYVEVEVDKVDKQGSEAPVNLIIEGELVPNAAAFEDVANNITDRAVTTAQVKWSIPAWTETSAKFQTPDISSILQELIGQEDWAPGNAIVLILRDDKDDPSTGVREAESYDGEADAAPLLHIGVASEIDIPVANGGDDAEQHLDDGDMDIGSSDLELANEDAGDPATDEQVIGLRFVEIPLDNGAPVVNAYVEVEVDKVDKQGSEAPVNLIIEGELAPDAAPFEDVANNITDRAVTTAQVKWSVPAWTETSAKFQTPDISSILQEIVNQEGWASKNAIVLIIRDDKDNPSTGLREAESYDGEEDAAPLLHIAGQLSLIKIATEPSPADGATGLSPAPPLSTYISDDVPMTIPDRHMTTTTVTSSLSVSDPITITDLNIELDITMPGNNADLNVYLKGPDGTQVELFTDVGLHSDGFTNTILDDEASTSVRNGRGRFTGIYRPESKLSAFDGKNAEGTWKLKISDDWAGNVGTLNSWRLVIESPIIFNWVPADRIASQDLYISDNFDDVNDSTNAAYQGNLAADASAIEVALDLGQTYYWRIDSLDADGMLVATGDTWNFSTAIGNIAISTDVKNGSDDAEEDLDGSADFAIDLGSSDLEFMRDHDDFPAGLQIVGVRFVDIGLPKGAEILSAYVQFDADDVDNDFHAGDVHMLIEGELNPNPDTFASEPENISARPRTAAVVPWSPGQWMATHLQSADEATSDISSIVQEIVDQDEWASGNALVLIFSEDSDPCNPSTGLREAESRNGAGSNIARRPTLNIAAIGETASNLAPIDGAIDIVQNTILTWSNGFSTISSDVYFGTDDSPKILETTTGASYDVGKLATSTTYYWRIDETDADGNKHTGAVQSFTTVIGEATNPYPTDYGANAPVDVVLSWTPGATAVSHDGYIGTTSPPDFLGNTTENVFDTAEIGGLEPETIYYWQLDAIEADGTRHVGEIWRFKTAGPGPGTRGLYHKGMNFEELVLVRTDPQIDFDWLEGEPDPAVGVDSFSVYWVADLVPAFSDTYTLSTETDDGVQVWLDGELIIDNWTDHGSTWDQSQPIELVAGQSYFLEMSYYENGGGAVARLHWESPTRSRRAVDALQLPKKALDPDPADGATIEATEAVFSWTAGYGAALHDVYLGTDPDALEFHGTRSEPMIPIEGFVRGTTYYWQIVEVEADETTIHEGPVWSFTIMPETAYDPSPADGAELASDAVVVLSWSSGIGAKLHLVYFGDDLDTVTNAAGAPPMPSTTFNPGPLEAGKTYYWRVDEFNPPTTVTGEVWSFTIAGLPWSIVNPGFEDPVLGEDGYTWLDVPGWTWVGSEGPGIWHVTSADFDPVVAPEGQNVLYTENAVGDAGGVAQVLTDTFAANTDFTLTVEIGNSYYYYWAGYSVQLLAGGIVIAEDNNTLWTDYMLWATSTVAYTYDPADSDLVGQPLEIRLLNLGIDMDAAAPGSVGVEFDNVRLEAAE